MLSGLDESLSKASAESSQIFCNAPNAPCKQQVKDKYFMVILK